ncbi:enoyl-CoA-hydratase DpgB [Kitasatospora aureofaciens]|uniref:enoyl-CoA-hydratase DpgB n=1 Tax=Kitasatospora aureofaciens TaxID=1894 RepID=UPI002109E5C6|nr:enoyl-CoA-hydratase DpgB [Kitasatospora aureofaciens]
MITLNAPANAPADLAEQTVLELGVDGSQPVTAELVAALNALCDRAEDAAPGAYVLLRLSGAPRGPWSAAGQDIQQVSRWERALRRLERLPVATVALAEGDCGGAAFETLLATDHRLARRDLRLLAPTGGEGMWPGMALYRLANQTGVAGSRRAVLLGAPITADRALALHLVDTVTDGDPAEAVPAVAALVAGLSGAELAIRRRLMFEATTTPFEESLGRHLAACDRVLRRAAGEQAGA